MWMHQSCMELFMSDFKRIRDGIGEFSLFNLNGGLYVMMLEHNFRDWASYKYCLFTSMD